MSKSEDIASEQPLLSICLPTRNHAELLRLGLKNIFQERRGCESRVEVVVSDNASSDHTPLVAAEWSHEPNYRVYRQPRDIGGNANIVFVPRTLARGRYCWLIGDDDFIMPGGLRTVLTLIEQHPQIDYFLLNPAGIGVEHRNRLVEFGTREPAQLPPGVACGPSDCSQVFNRLADVLETGKGNWQLFCHITAHIFRPELWRLTKLDREQFSLEQLFDCLENTVPHLLLLLRCAHNRPVYYHGPRVVLVGVGIHQCSKDYWMKVVLNSYEVAEAYASVGVRRAYRRVMLRHWMRNWLMHSRFIRELDKRRLFERSLYKEFLFRSFKHPLLFARLALWKLLKEATPEWMKRPWRPLFADRKL